MFKALLLTENTIEWLRVSDPCPKCGHLTLFRVRKNGIEQDSVRCSRKRSCGFAGYYKGSVPAVPEFQIE